MKRKSKIMILALSALFIGGVTGRAQQTETPKGKPIITIFGDGGVGFSDGKMTELGFNLQPERFKRGTLGVDNSLKRLNG